MRRFAAAFVPARSFAGIPSLPIPSILALILLGLYARRLSDHDL